MDVSICKITKVIAGGMNLPAVTVCGQESLSYVHRGTGRKIEKRSGTEYYVVRVYFEMNSKERKMIEIMKALADESRLRIVHLLLQGQLCVCELEYVLQMSQTNVSRHLAKLKNAGIVQSFKQAQWINYKIAPAFLSEEKLLVSYLQERLAQERICQEDLEALKRHQSEWQGCVVPSRKSLQQKRENR